MGTETPTLRFKQADLAQLCIETGSRVREGCGTIYAGECSARELIWHNSFEREASEI